MNTPAHLLVGTALFAKADRRKTYLAALAGSVTPDLSLYLMVSVSIWGMGVPAETVFREYYYSDAWQAVFAVDNSFIIWGAILALAFRLGSAPLMAFAGAGLIHLALDFPLHTHDARMHFWPLTDWVFVSPVSYWDHRAHAGIVGPLEVMLSLGAAVWLWQQFRHHGIRVATTAFMVMEAASSGIWRFIF
ncbi:MAG: cobalamin biosynthesis protein CobQ [Silicimonas sp.]|jgi:hypothetical protein|nr:cobalamin biosynthesis protein CobQ [Silicimonas sp.]